MKINTLIKACLLLFIAANAAAQNPTYEQTVEYIVSNTKGRVMYPGDLDAYSRVKGYNLKDIKIQKNGRIELHTDQKYDSNDFSIIFNIFDLVEKTDYPDGIRAHNFLVHFNGLNVTSGYGITFATDADAQKIARAFRHLKSLCTREGDLFAQPAPEETKKPKLGREATITYLQNKLAEYCAENNRADVTFENTITFDGPKGELKFKTSHQYSQITYTNNFNLGAIQSIEETNNPQLLYIGLRPDSGLENFYNYGTYWSDRANMPLWEVKQNETKKVSGFSVWIPSSDPQDLKRIKKAFERLIELNKDDADPFDD